VDTGLRSKASSGDLNLTNDGTFEKRVARGQVPVNRVPDVQEGFLLGRALIQAPSAAPPPVAAPRSAPSAAPRMMR
jgi:hypothetical protein